MAKGEKGAGRVMAVWGDAGGGARTQAMERV